MLNSHFLEQEHPDHPYYKQQNSKKLLRPAVFYSYQIMISVG